MLVQCMGVVLFLTLALVLSLIGEFILSFFKAVQIIEIYRGEIFDDEVEEFQWIGLKGQVELDLGGDQ